MTEGGKKRSSALDREVKGYLKPGNLALFRAYAGINEMGKSEALNVMVKRFFDNMPPEEKLRILNSNRNSY